MQRGSFCKRPGPEAPSASRVRLLGQPERWAFMRTAKPIAIQNQSSLAYNRLHKAIKTARMRRVRKGSGMAKLVFGMNQSLDGYVNHEKQVRKALAARRTRA